MSEKAPLPDITRSGVGLLYFCLPSNQMVHVGPLLLPAAAEQRAVVAPPAPGKLPAWILAIAEPGQYIWLKPPSSAREAVELSR